MILIADSGSTKTTWMEVESGNKVVTEGLNPHFTTEEQFLAACATVRQQFTIHNSQFTVIGATGRREDHTIGNISYLITFADEHPGADIEMLTDYGRFVATTGRRTFASFPRQQVSIFTMTPDIPINAIGLKWTLDGFHARLWWQATLNEALGDSFTLDSEGRIIVFQTYDPKQ